MPPAVLALKQCHTCCVVKDIDEFYKHPETRDGKHSNCKSCMYRRSRKWFAENPERGRELILEAKRRAYIANPELFKQRAKRWQENNPSARRAHRAAWSKRNPQAERERRRRRQALKLGSSVTFLTTGDLEAKAAYWGHKCWMCGADADTMDHVKPLRAGGPHILANLRPACRPCNSRKGARWPVPTTRRGDR